MEGGGMGEGGNGRREGRKRDVKVDGRGLWKKDAKDGVEEDCGREM